MSLKLEPVVKTDYIFLYKLLSKRKISENISHKKMPSLNQHLSFCKSKPYKFWYIVYNNKKKIGSAYITNLEELSIHLLPAHKTNIIYKNILTILMKKHPSSRYLANLNPKNKQLISIFEKFGFKLIQHTFELIPKENENAKKN